MKSPLPRLRRVLMSLIGQPVTLFDIHESSQRTTAVRGQCVRVALRADHTGTQYPCLYILRDGRVRNCLLKRTTLVFPGNAPLQTDVEASIGRLAAPAVYPAARNGTLNFMGEAPPIHRFLSGNLNRTFKAFDQVIAVRFDDDGAGLIIKRHDTPVFPEVPTNHAVVRRIREENGLGPGGK